MEKYTLQRIIHLRSNLTLLTNYDYKDTHNFVFNVLYEHWYFDNLKQNAQNGTDGTISWPTYQRGG